VPAIDSGANPIAAKMKVIHHKLLDGCLSMLMPGPSFSRATGVRTGFSNGWGKALDQLVAHAKTV
jgi:hypothetical protein